MSLYHELANRPRRHRANCSCADCKNGIKKINIISGFLGAGKTTLVKHLLDQTKDKKVDVVIREYGSATIDDYLVDYDKSRVHMYLGVSLHEAPDVLLYQYLERLYDTADRHPFDNLLLESSGAESAEDLVRMFMTGNLRAHYRLGSFITVVDAQFGELNLDEYRVARHQVAFADVIVINRTDLSDEKSIQRLISQIRQINSMAKIICTSFGNVEAEEVLDIKLYDQLKGLQNEEVDTAVEGISTVTITAEEPLELEKINDWFQELYSKDGAKILRGKGFLNISGSEYRYEFQSVRKAFHSKADTKWTLEDDCRSVLVLIGENLPDKEKLQQGFNQCKA